MIFQKEDKIFDKIVEGKECKNYEKN